ncbi:hypothetical protein [Lusitaniella coriacea]|uniref:hypothetical protein n=1 Tax=Lusitaniella coriacea TaxID=1983105 RepID=UPI003CF9BEA6
MPAIDLNPLFEFSRNNCVAICAFLVPANLFATLQTLLFFFLQRPPQHLRLSATLASSFAIVMVLHVYTWFAIGVVTPVTFVLLSLGSICLAVNIVACWLSPLILQHPIFNLPLLRNTISRLGLG